MQRFVYLAAALAVGAVWLAVSHFADPPAAHAQHAAAPAAAPAAPPPPAPGPGAAQDSGFYRGEAGLDPSERAGREIWYKATAGNKRFHTYTFPQRVGVLIDWYR